MPRLSLIIDEDLDNDLRKFADRYEVTIKRLVANGIPLAMRQHEKKVLAHAQTLAKQSKPTLPVSKALGE